jgi:DNA-directed RNA polymerase I subunit RPA2
LSLLTALFKVAVVGLNLKHGINQVTVQLREPRNPVIGDKFSSRHGQKGTLARLYPQGDRGCTPGDCNVALCVHCVAVPSRFVVWWPGDASAPELAGAG